jgi:HSP20 family protein
MFISMNGFNGGLFDELRRLERELDSSFGFLPSNIRSAGRGSYPPLNIGSTAEQVDVYLYVPGIDSEKLDISIQQNLLTVAGERRRKMEEEANYFRKERFDGAFRRVLTLPDDVDPDRVEASYVDGILHITVQRREAARPRQIEVN